MALGGSSNSYGSHNRGRPCRTMLLLVFGAVVLVVIVLLKLRERRFFNLIMKEKDRELFTLQLIWQKERDIAKETQKQIEEMNTKLRFLRVKNKLLSINFKEMEGMKYKLQEENRALESALKEKENEIKVLNEREIDSDKENSQVAENKGIKCRCLQNEVKIWSVSTDGPSNQPVNLTAMKKIAKRVVNEVGDSKKKVSVSEDGKLLRLVNSNDDRTSSRRRGIGEKNGGQGQVKRGGIGYGKLKRSKNSQDGEGSKEIGNMGNINAIELVENPSDGEGLRSRDEDERKAMLEKQWMEMGMKSQNWW